MSEPDEIDRHILDLLEGDARMPVSAIAQEVGLARATVKDRMDRLEATGIIAGYTIRLNDAVARRRIAAHVMIGVDPKRAREVVAALTGLRGLKSLYAVSGQHDLIAVIRADTTEALDRLIDDIGAIEGVENTVTSVILSTKLDR